MIYFSVENQTVSNYQFDLQRNILTKLNSNNS